MTMGDEPNSWEGNRENLWLGKPILFLFKLCCNENRSRILLSKIIEKKQNRLFWAYDDFHLNDYFSLNK